MVAITFNLATYPARIESATRCINNLLGLTVDLIRVYCNEFTVIPDSFPKSERVIYQMGENLKDSGKFFWSGEKRDEFYFSADDDQLYTQQYIDRHLKILYKSKKQLIVTSMGKVMKSYPLDFTDFSYNFRLFTTYFEDYWINLPGTGSLAFYLYKIQIPISLFKYHGMADLWVGLYCQLNKIPILCRAHDENEVIDIIHEDTLWIHRDEMKAQHKEILDSTKWELYEY